MHAVADEAIGTQTVCYLAVFIIIFVNPLAFSIKLALFPQTPKNPSFIEINLLIADPEIFPTKYGYPFKENFVNSTIKRILKMLINVLCHFYTHKVFARLYEQSLHTRLNRVFSHAILLIKHAELKDVVDFRAHCLTDLIAVLTER